MNVVDDTGAYSTTTFVDVNNLEWSVIGTKGDGKLSEAVDFLKSENGDYSERTREQMYKASKSGKIKPVVELSTSEHTSPSNKNNNQLETI